MHVNTHLYLFVHLHTFLMAHNLHVAGKSLSSKSGSHPPCYIRTGCNLSKCIYTQETAEETPQTVTRLTIVSVSAKPKQTCCNIYICVCKKVIIFVFDVIRTITCKVTTIHSLLNLGTQPSHCRPDKTCKKTK